MNHAADPENREWALGLARRMGRGWRRYRDDLGSAALLGLVEAARDYRPERSLEFRAFARRRVVGAMLDLLRKEMPKAFRRRRNGRVAPAVASLAAHGITRDGFDMHGRGRSLVSDDGPVGWELESFDAMEGLLRVLPARKRAVMRLLYGHAGATLTRAGCAAGVCESRAFQVHAESLVILRERLGREVSA